MIFHPAPPGSSILPNSERARHAILFLRIIAVLQALHAVVSFSLFRSVDTGGDQSALAMLISVLFGLVNYGVFVLTAVFFILWMRRAYANLHKAGVPNLSHSEGWAAVSWFVPVLNFIWPYTVVKEIWTETQAAFRSEPFEPQEHGLVRSWWSCFTGTWLLSMAGGFIFSILQLRAGMYLTAFILDILLLLAAVYSARMVRLISAMEDDMRQRAEIHFQLALAASARQTLQEETISFAPPIEKPGRTSSPEDFLAGPFLENKRYPGYAIVGLFLFTPFALLYAFLHFYILAEDSPNAVQTVTNILDLLNSFSLVVVLAIFLFILLWMNRAYRNLHNLRIEGLSFPAGMAAGGWFIPVANLAIPYLVLVDIARHTTEAIRKFREPEKFLPAPPLMAAWVCTILGVFLGWLSTVTNDQSLSYDLSTDRLNGAVFGLAGSACTFAAVYCMIVSIRRITLAETLLFESVEKRSLELNGGTPDSWLAAFQEESPEK